MKITAEMLAAKRDELRKITCNGNKLDEMMRPFVKEMWDGVEVGDGVTVHLWTDSHAYTVIARTAKTLTLRRCKAIRMFTPEWVVGGFSAICTNQGDQEWAYEEDEYGAIEKAHWSDKKNGFYVNGCCCCSVGRHEYYDYNF